MKWFTFKDRWAEPDLKLPVPILDKIFGSKYELLHLSNRATIRSDFRFVILELYDGSVATRNIYCD